MTTLTETNSIHRSPLLRGLLLIPLLLASFALLPKAQAVSPAPDGAYPGFNTAEGGPSALAQAVPGVWNTAIGQFALNLDVSGGTGNTAVGLNALRANTLGDFNSALGVNALRFNVIGNNNTALGYQALFVNIGSSNTAAGVNALSHNTTGFQNAAVGQGALGANILGAFNTALGFQALASNNNNNNTAVGWKALGSNTSGHTNTANGLEALLNNDTGSFNTAIGVGALAFNTTGSQNIALGIEAGENVISANNVISIGSVGANVSNSCYIGNIFGAAINGASAASVGVDATGKLGTMASAQRFKKDIKPMDQASEAILGLKPVTFHYKSDTSGFPQFGLVAEEVAKVNPDLVVRDAKGEIYTVRYDAVNAMLLNEFLKEHRKVEEQEATIVQLKKDFQSRLAEQQKQIKALTTGLEKVNNQLELSKPAPQVVVSE